MSAVKREWRTEDVAGGAADAGGTEADAVDGGERQSGPAKRARTDHGTIIDADSRGVVTSGAGSADANGVVVPPSGQGSGGSGGAGEGAVAEAAAPPGVQKSSLEKQLEAARKVSIATVCHANVNRSVAAQVALQKAGFRVKSYGVGSTVKLPAKAGVMAFPFGTPYGDMLDVTLSHRDRSWYEQIGVLRMLRRDLGVKKAPERFQDSENPSQFNLIICFATHVFTAVTEDLGAREPDEFKQVHVVNFEIKDNEQSASKGAEAALSFAKACNAAGDLDDNISLVIDEFKADTGMEIMYSMHLL